MADNNKKKLLKKIAYSETLPALSPLAIKLVELAADDGNLSAKTFGGDLGLAMTRKVVEAHKGRISLTVLERRGNRVTLWPPAAA